MTTLTARRLAGPGPTGTAIADVAASPTGDSFAVGVARTIAVASWGDGAERWRTTATSEVDAIAYSPDGGRIALACRDGVVRIVDAVDAREIARLDGAHGGYGDLAWSPDGMLLAGGHFEPLVTVFDVEASTAVVTLDPEIASDEGRTAVAFSPDGTTLASTAYNTIIRWTLPLPGEGRRHSRGKIALRSYAFFVDVAFSPDGGLLAGLAETEGRFALHLWEGEGGSKRGHLALPHFSQRMAWASDGSCIAVIERDEPGISLWDPVSLAASVITHEGVDMSAAVIASHPRHVAFIAGSETGELAIWEIAGSTS